MSAGIAGWIARLAFPALLAIGWLHGDLGPKGTTLFVFLGLAAWVALPRLVTNGADFITPALAILDIALVLVVFKGDVRIT